MNIYAETKDVELDKLIPFEDDQKQTYEGDWRQQLTDCIKRASLTNPVIVRPVGDGKYEVTYIISDMKNTDIKFIIEGIK